MNADTTFFNYKPSSGKDKNGERKLVTVVSLRSEADKKGKKYFLAQKLDGGFFELQELNEKKVPSGSSKNVTTDDFATEYTLELDYWHQEVRPSMDRLNRTLERGEVHREHGELYSAEMEYADALEVDEGNVRATFGLGQTYFEKGDVEKAQEVFSKVLQMKTAFAAKHKHMFNDFGISMRKNGLYREALQYYNRGIDLDSDDENLFFNIARTHYEAGDWENCFRYLTLCLEKNRGVEEARKFCNYLVKKSTSDDHMLKELSSADNTSSLRSDILNLLRKMQLAAGVDLDDAIEKTHEIRDRMIELEEEDMKIKEIEKNLYNLDDDF
ncbi:tetratricopeptide repeat protein [Maridesulfovibrio hydrothermalis]|uniref:TPR repeat-containing protein n=1 Tax=Maridesulfovibrio hydrothermalis AM13 = DSM 14728 TaxID=1121451 RepID=L0R870_9BACT|nr:tetratricopeptide repeat protein [Maridesulfovibrio hydrothermalis]CCO22395.1 TPR repeat-containing protein [Maridesulfovibrio hydrothermalis AM13 = DSM 14728]